MPVYADVENGQCVNIILADESFREAFTEAFPEHEMVGPLDDLEPQPGIGWSYVNGEWFRPEPREEPQAE